MIQAFLFLHLLLQPQAVAPQAVAPAKVLLQSGIDAENRNDHRPCLGRISQGCGIGSVFVGSSSPPRRRLHEET